MMQLLPLVLATAIALTTQATTLTFDVESVKPRIFAPGLTGVDFIAAVA